MEVWERELKRFPLRENLDDLEHFVWNTVDRRNGWAYHYDTRTHEHAYQVLLGIRQYRCGGVHYTYVTVPFKELLPMLGETRRSEGNRLLRSFLDVVENNEQERDLERFTIDIEKGLVLTEEQVEYLKKIIKPALQEAIERSESEYTFLTNLAHILGIK